MKEGVNKWITDNYQDLYNTTKNIVNGNDADILDDLFQEVIIMFIENKKSEDIVKRHKEAKWFFIRILLNQYRSSTSYFHKQYRRVIKGVEPIDDITNQVEEEYDIDTDILIDYNLEIIEEMLLSEDNLERYYAFIMMMYFSNGHNFAEVARLLKVSRTTIRRQFDIGAKLVIQKMKSHNKNLEYKNLPIKILTTQLLRGYGKGRRF